MHGRGMMFLVSLLVLSLSISQAKKKSKQLPEPVTASDSKASLGSGQLSTKDGHRCSWETLERGANLLLQVSCSTPVEGLTYTCQFAGKPQECAAYSSQSSQYWKQVVSKLKKRRNACEGEKVLKTRLCKKAPSASHMKLTEKSAEEATTLADGGKLEAGTQARDVDQEEEKKKDGELRDVLNDGFLNTEPAVSYCGEGWHSVCNFFVKFFDG